MPQNANPDRRPDYCGSTLFKLDKMADDLGQFGEKASTAFVVAGVVSGGTGLVPALGFEAASGLVQVGGAGLQALAGDPTAGRRMITGAIGTVLSNLSCHTTAYLYYLGVADFGWSFYRK